LRPFTLSIRVTCILTFPAESEILSNVSSAPIRILVTRAAHQASELADRLRELHFVPILIPTIELTTPTSFAALDAALPALDTFHWLLFTSANAVEAFHQRLQLSDPQALGSTPFKPLIAAIGPATARALTAVGLTPTLLPPQAVAESLAATLLPLARQPDGTPTRFLLVRAEQARDLLPETLRAAGAEVTIAPAYRTIVPPTSIEAISNLVATTNNQPDAITFTSSSTVTNLFHLLKSAGLTLPPAILRASIGPITTQTLQSLGYPPQIEALEPTVPALAEALKNHYFTEKNPPA
jgi:uroporphyrinogen-III synthase